MTAAILLATVAFGGTSPARAADGVARPAARTSGLAMTGTEDPAGSTAAAGWSDADLAQYGAREQDARTLEQFQGGGHISIYMGGSTVAVVLLIVLLIILL